MKSRLYYEAHLTVAAPKRSLTDLLTGHKSFGWFRKLAATAWRVSRFSDDDVDGLHLSNSWFMTTRHNDLATIKRAVEWQIETLGKHGLVVTRWKIENTELDSKYGDYRQALCGKTHDDELRLTYWAGTGRVIRYRHFDIHPLDVPGPGDWWQATHKDYDGAPDACDNRGFSEEGGFYRMLDLVDEYWADELDKARGEAFAKGLKA